MAGNVATLIIPGYIEIDGIPQRMRRLTAVQANGEMAAWEVLFVNDGSKDGTREALETISQDHDWVRVIQHRTNRGLGTAVRTGFESAQASVVCTMEVLSQGATRVYRRLLRSDIHSFTPMHLVYRREVTKTVKFDSNGFAAIAERATFSGSRVKELPMPVNRRQFSESKIKIYRSITAHLSLMRRAGWTKFSMWADAKLAGARFAIEE